MATRCDDDIQALRDEIRDLKETVATLKKAVIETSASRTQHPRPGYHGSVAPVAAPVQVYQAYECDSDDDHSPMQCCSAMFEREADMRAHLGSDW